MIKKILNMLWNVSIGISIGMITIMFVFNLLMVNYIKRELIYIYTGIETTNYYLSQLEQRIIEKEINGIKNDTQLLELFYNLKNVLVERDDILADSIIKIIKGIERKFTESEQIENNLKQVTVMIENITYSYQGSGVTLKYKDNYYILSAAHLIEENTDELYIVENDELIAKLKIIKIDTRKDLVLLKLEDENNIPKIYTELAEKELEKGDPIYVIGNPLGIEDVLSEGRILKNKGFFTYFIDHSYFGSSGGGIFTKQGKLLGIIQTIGSIQPYENIPGFVINGAGRLNMIKDFLGDIK